MHAYFTRSVSHMGGYYQYFPSVDAEPLVRTVVDNTPVWRWTSTNGSTYQASDEPSEADPVSFYPLVDGVPDTTATPLVLTFTDYVLGAETTSVLVEDVCRYL